MKLTINELKGMKIGLEEAMLLKIPPKTAYWFKRFIEKVVSEMKATEKVRMTLAVKYAKKDKKGEPIFKKEKGKTLNEYDVTKDNLLKFAKEFDEICQTEIDFPFEPIKLDMFGDTKISGDLLYKLGKLVEEE